MRRLFVAIDISEGARNAAASHVEKVKSESVRAKVSLEKPEKFHVTINFIGNTPGEEVVGIGNALASIAMATPRFELMLADTGVFPSRRAARILWLGVVGQIESLESIADNLQTVLKARGFPQEERAFKPHITIARIRDPRS